MIAVFHKNGLPLTDEKGSALTKPIAVPRCTAPLYVPLSLGGPAQMAMLATDTPVARGDVLFQDAAGFPTLCPVTGTVRTYTAVEHPMYGELICAVVAPAEEPGEVKKLEIGSHPDKTGDGIITAARRAGIVDELDGRPLHEKLTEWQNAGYHIVADAVEAEPYASSAFAVLREQGEAVRRGLKAAVQATGATGSNIAVCAVSPFIKQALSEKFSEGELYFAEERYPVTVYTAEKTELVGRIGVQALVALHDAIETDVAPADCVITVAGDGVRESQNVRVPFGTPVQEVLRVCGLDKEAAAVIAGDVMTGTLLPDISVPVVPGMTCLLVMSSVPVAENGPCIGCGRCAEVCHKELLPYEIGRRLENMHYDELSFLHPEECDGCGACTWICPSARDVMYAVLSAGETDGPIFLNWGGNEDG